MKNKKRSLSVLCATLLVSLLAAFAVACGGGNKTYDENGKYCSYDNNIVVNELVLNNGNFTLKLGSNDYSGSYKLKDGNLSFKLSGTDVSATYADGMITFTFGDDEYVLYVNTDCTVSFNVKDGGSLPTVTVKRGQALTSTSVTEPEKFGYVFDGWYLDSEYQDKYVMGSTPITGNRTLYGRFVSNEYTVSFVTGAPSVTFADRLTENCAVTNLPAPEVAGKEFVGWWVSDTQNPDKLTYQINNGDKLNANTKLFAVYKSDAVTISVTQNRIIWTPPTAGTNSYEFKLTPPTGDPVTRTTGETAYFNPDFSQAGEYKVEVTLDGHTATAYYTSKILPRVSFFNIENNVFKFANVEGAEDYYITVKCGNSDHKHTDVKLGKDVFSYNFAGCTMPAEGIRFTVRATANGRVASVSDEVVYYKGIKVENVTYDKTDDVVEWDDVDNAVAYRAEIKVGNETFNVSTGTRTSLSLKQYSGVIVVKVYAIVNGYYAEDSNALTVEKDRLATPTGLTLNGSDLTWNAVDGAASYNVKIGNDTVRNVTAARFSLNTIEYTADLAISVQAVAQGSQEDKNSYYSDPFVIKFEEMGTPVYENGVLTWDYVSKAAKYVVKVNDGEEMQVPAGKNEFEVELTQKGDNVVAVSYYTSANVQSDWKQVVVNAHQLTFNYNDGQIVVYRAVGDKVNAPKVDNTATKVFAGWYDKEGGPDVNAAKYEDEYFAENGDLVLYAYYATAKYVAHLVITPEEGTVSDNDREIEFGSGFELPVPVSADPMKYFDGWFSEVNGVGTRYTDNEGQSVIAWGDTDTKNLYPRWISVLNYTLRPDGKSYSVRKGEAISLVNSVVIPEKLSDGKPVTMIEPGAFAYCSNLTSVTFYNTMEIVDLGLGGMSTNSAFQGCDKLASITVLPVTNNTDAVFQTIDGVLFRSNPANNNGVELYFYPMAKTDAGTEDVPYEVPYGVRVIPTNAFREYKGLQSIKIPATVERIDSEAFSRCLFLTNVEFLDEPATKPENKFTFAEVNTDEATSLTLGSLAFYLCYRLESIELPSRFSDDVTFTEHVENSSNPYEGDWEIFRSCSVLKSVTVKSGNAKYSSKTITVKNDRNEDVTYGLLLNKAGNKVIFAPRAIGSGIPASTVFNMPAGVTTIGKYAFANCYYIKNLNLSGAITTIEEKAFYKATGMAKLTFGGTAADEPLTIGKEAFNGIAAASLVMPANLKEVKVGAFGISKSDVVFSERTVDLNCLANATFDNGAFEGVTSVNLGANVPANFGVSGVFGSTLQSVTVAEGGNFKAEDGVLFNSDFTSILYYPTAKTGDYELKDTVKVIGNGVFEGKAIQNITIHSGVTNIGENAFKDCVKLETVTFVSTGRTDNLVIEKNAFMGCEKIEEIILPEKTTTVGDSAFEGCLKLGNVTLPATLEKMGEYNAQNVLTSMNVFKNCPMLASIEVATANTAFKTVDDVLYLQKDGKPTELLVAPTAKSGAVDIPKTVEKIWANAFSGNTGITEVKFTEGLDLGDGKSLVIGDNVFENATGLQHVYLVDGVSKIGASAFKGCINLISVDIPKTVTSIEANAFQNCEKLADVNFLDIVKEDDEASKTAPIGEALTIVGGNYNGSSVFSGCNSLTDLILPRRFTSINDYTFAKMANLASVELQGNISNLGGYAFQQCTNLTSVTFTGTPTFTVMGNNVFEKTGLTSFVMPNSVVTMNQSVFNGAALTSVTLSNKLETIGVSAFADTALTEITFPASLKTIGSEAFRHNTFSSDKAIKARLTALKTINFPADGNIEILAPYSYGAFEGNMGLTSVTIKGVTKIEKNTFKNCTALKTVTFADNKCATIGDNAFEKTALTAFTFPTVADNATLTLGKSLFNGCLSLYDVTLSKSVTDVMSGSGTLFDGCVTIEQIHVDTANPNFGTKTGYNTILFNKEGKIIKLVFGELPVDDKDTFEIMDGTTEISSKSFVGQHGVKKIIIPASVTAIQASAFNGLKGLEEVEFKTGSKLATLGDEAFKDCVNLTKITVPNTVANFGEGVFRGCTSLTEAQLPSGLTEIKKNTFLNCTSLSKVTVTGTTVGAGVKFALPSGVVTLGESAFSGTAFTSVDITKVTTINNSVFKDCKQLLSAKVGKYDTVGNNLFSGCEKLNNVTLNDEITALGNNMFDSCKELKTITLPSKLTFLGTGTFKSSGLTSITIPSLVQHIGQTAGAVATASSSVSVFDGCTKLSSVTLPTGLSSIGGNVFNGCSALTSITLPTGCLVVGQYCFAGTEISTIDVSHVTTFGSRAFYNCKALTGVKLNGTLTAIPDYMFYGCTSIESMEIPANVTEIGANAFQNCTLLSEITLPDNMVTIKGYAFNNCTSLTSIDLPSNLTNLYGNAFDSCGLKSITIPAKVASFTTSSWSTSSSVFKNCKSLETVVFEGTALTTLLSSMFEGCSALKNVTLPTNLSTVKGTYGLFSGCTALETITLPNALKVIPAGMFTGCTNLTTVIVASDLTEIGENAFKDCAKLTSFNIPDTVTMIGASAFENAGLTEITIPENVGGVGSKAFKNAVSLETVAFLGENTDFYYLSYGSKYAASNIFEGCVSLAKVDLPLNLKKLPDGIFTGCTNLTEITLPESLTEIGGKAFVGAGIETLDLPAGFTTFKLPYSVSSYGVNYYKGTGAFAGMDNLTAFNIPENNPLYYTAGGAIYDKETGELLVYPNGKGGAVDLSAVSAIGMAAFDGCNDIGEITLPATLTEVPAFAFANSGVTAITVPEGYTAIGNNAFEACANLASVTLPSTLKTIGDEAFTGCAALTAITLPNGLTEIAYGAFFEAGLTGALAIPATVKKIGSSAFYSCAALTSVNLPAGLEELGTMAFYKSGLTSIEVPASITDLGSSMFDGCEALTSVTLHEGLKTIGSGAFAKTGIESITIPASVQSFNGYGVFQNCKSLKTVKFLGSDTKLWYMNDTSQSTASQTFDGCESLTSVTLPSNLDMLPDNTFRGCTSLVSITIPDTVSETGEGVFSGCVKLYSVKLPDALTKINNKTFNGCIGLTSVTYGTKVTEIGSEVFVGCENLETFEIKDSITTIGSNAFEGCTSLTSIIIPASVNAVGPNAFKGWNSTQTINVVKTPFRASVWTGTWNADCEASIVWGYKAA